MRREITAQTSLADIEEGRLASMTTKVGKLSEGKCPTGVNDEASNSAPADAFPRGVNDEAKKSPPGALQESFCRKLADEGGNLEVAKEVARLLTEGYFWKHKKDHLGGGACGDVYITNLEDIRSFALKTLNVVRLGTIARR